MAEQIKAHGLITEITEITDEKGFVWYGKSVEVSPNVEIRDTSQGKERIIRVFNIMKPPGDKRTGEQISREIQPFIKDTLFRSGLTTDDNFAPRILEKGDRISIIVVSKPSSFHPNIHEGMKSGQGNIDNLKGLKIISHKTDNINKLLNDSANT